jgi:hypothetical protein
VGKSYSAPPAPDPKLTAETQGEMNKDTALFNRNINMFDEVGPGYRVTYQPIAGPKVNTAGFEKLKTPTGEQDYLSRYADVAEALKAPGATSTSAWDHFQKFGQAEGRTWNGASRFGDNQIDPYVGVQGGKAQFDQLRRDTGFQGEFGGGRFEDYLKNSAYDTRVNYINKLIDAGADPDYIAQLTSGLPDPSTATNRYRRLVEMDPASKANYDAEQALTGRLFGTANDQLSRINTALSTPLNTQGLPELQGSVYDAALGGNYALANGKIDPFVGLGQDRFNQLRRDAGFSGEFGGGAFENWLSGQSGDVKQKYISELRANGVDPDYLIQLGEKPDTAFDLNRERNRSESALFDRLNPQLQRQREAKETQLMNMGVTPGSARWISEMDDLSRQENDLRLGVTGQGLAEMQGLFGMKLSDAQLANAARSQGLQERAYNQNQPINQLSALLGLTQVQQPQATIPAPQGIQAQSGDYQGAVYNNYQGALQQAQMKQSASNALLGGLFGLGGAALGGWARNWGK